MRWRRSGKKNRHFVHKRLGHLLYLFISFQWTRCLLLGVNHQTLVWICYLRACLLGRHGFYKLALESYEELEKLFKDFKGEEYRYWIVRSWLDRALICRDMKDRNMEDLFYDRIIQRHTNDENILIQCVVAMAGIFKACSRFNQSYTLDAYSLIDWVMQRTMPPKPDYLQELFISASVTKSTFFTSEKNWQSNYHLCERDIKRFSQVPHLYAKRIVAASEHDRALMLMLMWRYEEALDRFEEVAAKYKHSNDLILLLCSYVANYYAGELRFEVKRKIKKPIEVEKSPLDHWSLFTEFVNPNLN